MKRVAIVFFLIITSLSCVKAQDLSAYQKKWFVSGGDTMPYRLLLPENFDTGKNYPVLFFLHGSGERGNDNESQLAHAGKVFTAEAFRKKYQAIVIFPQASAEGYWSNVERHEDDPVLINRYRFKNGGAPNRDMLMLMRLVRTLLQEFHPLKGQVYVGGLSMGGMGTFELVSRMPGTFAKAFAICGGANPAIAPKLSGTKWRVYHGMKDDVVSSSFSINMVKAMRRQGINADLTIFPKANHNAWDPALADEKLMPWLFGK